MEKDITSSNIVEINGRYTCLECGYEWSGMMDDSDIPLTCDCKEKNT